MAIAENLNGGIVVPCLEMSFNMLCRTLMIARKKWALDSVNVFQRYTGKHAQPSGGQPLFIIIYYWRPAIILRRNELADVCLERIGLRWEDSLGQGEFRSAILWKRGTHPVRACTRCSLVVCSSFVRTRNRRGIFPLRLFLWKLLSKSYVADAPLHMI